LGLSQDISQAPLLPRLIAFYSVKRFLNEMPKPRAFVRHKRWALKTSPNLFHPRLEALRETTVRLISDAYLGIDDVYAKVSGILDRRGIVGPLRIFYRSFAEELWKQAVMHRGNLLDVEIRAIGGKYSGYGLDFDILREIALIFGVELRPPVVAFRSYSFDHAVRDYTLGPRAEVTIVSIRAVGHVDIIWEGDGDGTFLMRVYIDGRLEEEFYTDEARFGTYAFESSFEIRLYNPLDITATHTSMSHSVRGVTG